MFSRKKKIGTIESVVNFELKHLVDWLRANILSLNESEYKLVLFRSKNSRTNTSNIAIKLNRFKLEPVNFVK